MSPGIILFRNQKFKCFHGMITERGNLHLFTGVTCILSAIVHAWVYIHVYIEQYCDVL